jgi:hypothetical protein
MVRTYRARSGGEGGTTCRGARLGTQGGGHAVAVERMDGRGGEVASKEPLSLSCVRNWFTAEVQGGNRLIAEANHMIKMFNPRPSSL